MERTGHPDACSLHDDDRAVVAAFMDGHEERSRALASTGYVLYLRERGALLPLAWREHDAHIAARAVVVIASARWDATRDDAAVYMYSERHTRYRDAVAMILRRAYWSNDDGAPIVASGTRGMVMLDTDGAPQCIACASAYDDYRYSREQYRARYSVARVIGADIRDAPCAPCAVLLRASGARHYHMNASFPGCLPEYSVMTTTLRDAVRELAAYAREYPHASGSAYRERVVLLDDASGYYASVDTCYERDCITGMHRHW